MSDKIGARTFSIDFRASRKPPCKRALPAAATISLQSPAAGIAIVRFNRLVNGMITAPGGPSHGLAFSLEILKQTRGMFIRYPLHTTILLVALALPCSTASALDDAKTKAISNAADTFARLASDSAKTAQAPRQTDPAVKPLLDLVCETSELQKGATQPMSALINLNTWQGAVLKVGLVYTLAGTGVTDIAALSNTPEITEKIERNTVEFAPEMGRYCDAILWVQGALMDTVAAFLATASPSQREQPNIKSGTAKMRAGFAQTMDGVLTTLLTTGLTENWRRERVTVLTAIAPKAVRFLLPDQLRLCASAQLKWPVIWPIKM